MMNKSTSYYPETYPELKERLAQVFMKHAINNRGVLTSPRQADTVAARLASILLDFLNGECYSSIVADRDAAD